MRNQRKCFSGPPSCYFTVYKTITLTEFAFRIYISYASLQNTKLIGASVATV